MCRLGIRTNMLGRIGEWLTAHFSSEQGGDESKADDTEPAEKNSRFVPSRLDASVRAAHGGGGAEIERELAAIEAKARLLEDEDRTME